MNQHDKERISHLRKEGLGYKRIAIELGINVNTVKSYCRANQLTSEHLGQFICKQCGKDLLQVGGRKKRVFCCHACKVKWWNSHRTKQTGLTIICPHCGVTFRAYPHEHRKYCSHTCYVMDRFQGGDDNDA